jgi:hypothetical protein
MTAAAHQPNPEAPGELVPEIVLVLLGHDERHQPSLERLQDLLFLVDREHARSFGVVLTFLSWVREESGPRTNELVPVLEALDRAGQLPPGLLATKLPRRHIAEPQAPYRPDQPNRFPPKAARSLQRVLWKYGSATDDSIHEAIESTHAYGITPVGEQIDLSGERVWLMEEVKARGTDRSQWGDPAASAAEDEEIMEFFDRWRMSARRGHQER